MTFKELYQRVLGIYKSPDLPAYDPNALAQALLADLQETWDLLPESTRTVMLGVATALKKEFADGVLSDLQAAEVVRGLRK